MKALSVRQPWAELIMRGIKTTEYRSRPTTIRGRIYIYAAMGRTDPDDEAYIEAKHGIDVDSLPRGVIVGTIELYDCDGDEWQFRKPKRATVLRKPDNHPMPVWFTPFVGEEMLSRFFSRK
jgi:hypothetical protein